MYFQGLKDEGWIDPSLLLSALRSKNINNGIEYCKGMFFNDFKCDKINALHFILRNMFSFKILQRNVHHGRVEGKRIARILKVN